MGRLADDGSVESTRRFEPTGRSRDTPWRDPSQRQSAGQASSASVVCSDRFRQPVCSIATRAEYAVGRPGQGQSGGVQRPAPATRVQHCYARGIRCGASWPRAERRLYQAFIL